MAERIVTVFGGTGFLGRHAVRHLLGQRLVVRIASRHPERAPSPEGSTLQSIRADINGEAAVAAAVAGAYGVVNAVSLYRERGTETFHALHVKAAERLARHAQRAGVERFVHVSGIGADAASSSLYIRSRGEGELAVQAAFANAIIVRPAVMFGQDDAFLNTLVTLLKRFPAYPMFGRGLTRLQPVFVEDVAEAIARCLQRGGAASGYYTELGRTAALYLRGAPRRRPLRTGLAEGPPCFQCHFRFGARSLDQRRGRRDTAKPLQVEDS